jgi:hypothetical protein|tara:strand:+ start:87 stop:473 length:387 start_codon:yes stop_codon:yes gene_type:complete
MANNTITFDPSVRTPYGVNLTMYTGVDFEETFKILNNDRSNYNLTSHTMYSQMTKTVSIGSSGVPTASFTETITDATKGEFKIALAKATTIPIKSGRYEYDIIMGVGSSLYSVARGNINVFTGISTDT